MKYVQVPTFDPARPWLARTCGSCGAPRNALCAGGELVDENGRHIGYTFKMEPCSNR